MTRQIGGELTLTLPEDWWLIVLDDPDGRRAMVDEIVAASFRGAGPLAGLRVGFRRDLAAMVEEAASGGAVAIALSVAAPGAGTPPASVTIVRVPAASVRGDDGVGLARRLEEVAVPGTVVERAQSRFGPVVRRVRSTSEVAVPGSGTARQHDGLAVDYWLEPEPGGGLLLFAFSSPVLELREELLALFDAIVASLGVLHDRATGDGAPRSS